MNQLRVDLSDPELFGNEMAEDEEERLFASYAYERPEFAKFIDPVAKILVARAYKGEGKSALLRWTSLQLKRFTNVVAHSAYANALVPAVADRGDDYIRLWKESFIRSAANALGARLELSFSDDVISLREQAERNGFVRRGFVGAVLARLGDLPGAPRLAGAEGVEGIFRRVMGANDIQVWIVVDDLDENFRDTEADCLKVMSALVAMRQLTNEIPELRMRASIRPSTWAIIKRKYEALSKIEPYMLDLQWSQSQLEDLLGARVRSYLSRNSGVAVAGGQIGYLSSRELVAVAFDDPMPWGRKEVDSGLVGDFEVVDKRRAPSVVVATLARYRPRWMIELCKLAAARSAARARQKIGLDDLTNNLEDFGKKRVEDLVAEFRAQCEKVELMLQSFKGKPEQFKTDELVRHVRANLTGRDIRIAGVSGQPTEIEMIRFLFQVGFLTARRDFPDKTYRHYSFFDEPSLLSNGANDLGVSWEVPSCYRQALQLKNSQRKMPR